MNNQLYKNGGNFFFKFAYQSISLFNQCEFIENSCLLFHVLDSEFSIDNTSIIRNCVSDSFCIFNNSKSVLLNSQFNYNSCGPILNSTNSELEIAGCFFSNNISPSDLILINFGKISVNSSIWVNSTTTYGSSISTFKTIFTISNSSFNSSHSRICGASILARSTEFESISNSFINSKSLAKGLSICLISCPQNSFKISQTSFYNNKNEKGFSIYSHQCSGTIQDSIFNRTIDDEIPISLHEKSYNCTFMTKIYEKNSISVIDYSVFLDSLDNDFNEKIKILIVVILIFLIICLFWYRKKLKILFRNFSRKHDN